MPPSPKRYRPPIKGKARLLNSGRQLGDSNQKKAIKKITERKQNKHKKRPEDYLSEEE
ncbi:MAG: hypothetical protein Q7S21_06440 [archaeon]|nr:hypothetical protein [archaeon]